MEIEKLKDYQIENLLKINASYNGDLGTLQKNTKNSLDTLRNLLALGILEEEQGEKYSKIILDYFKTEIKKVLENTLYYL